MSIKCFDSILYDINGWNIVKVPISISTDFPSRGMVMAEGTINDLPLLISLEPDGKGSHWLHIDDVMFNKLNLTIGDTVKVSLDPLSNWIEPQLPDYLLEPLKANQLYKQWMTLTPKAQWDWIRWIRATKNSSTRAKRIEVTCSKLSSGDRRPCCFNRNICTITDVSKNGILLIS